MTHIIKSLFHLLYSAKTCKKMNLEFMNSMTAVSMFNLLWNKEKQSEQSFLMQAKWWLMALTERLCSFDGNEAQNTAKCWMSKARFTSTCIIALLFRKSSVHAWWLKSDNNIKVCILLINAPWPMNVLLTKMFFFVMETAILTTINTFRMDYDLGIDKSHYGDVLVLDKHVITSKLVNISTSQTITPLRPRSGRCFHELPFINKQVPDSQTSTTNT